MQGFYLKISYLNVSDQRLPVRKEQVHFSDQKRKMRQPFEAGSATPLLGDPSAQYIGSSSSCPIETGNGDGKQFISEEFLKGKQ